MGMETENREASWREQGKIRDFRNGIVGILVERVGSQGR